MSTDTALTVPTRFVEAGGIRFAYRRWGKPGGPPLVFLQYFSANLDDWDPQVTDDLADDYDVILFDNAGVGSSRAKRRAPSRRWHRTPSRSRTPSG
jgi:pimeloyl-ACP methyl ester carboxylesterase